jgi:DNA-binding LacI/PurR family transcriptional regulator
VVGLDGHFLAALFNPVLTTVQLPVPELARVMVERVMHPQSDARAGEAARVIPPTGLIVRESVARPATAARKNGRARR